MSDKKMKLCKWNQKTIQKESAKYWEHVKSPEYLCSKCGRVAMKKGMICKPVYMKS